MATRSAPLAVGVLAVLLLGSLLPMVAPADGGAPTISSPVLPLEPILLSSVGSRPPDAAAISDAFLGMDQRSAVSPGPNPGVSLSSSPTDASASTSVVIAAALKPATVEPQSVSTLTATSLTVLAGWEGLQYGSNHGVLDYVDPPDVPLGVGPNHVFELANGLGILWTKDGTFVQLVNPQSLFQTAPTDGIGDARVIYDAPSGRWFASAADFTTGNVVLSVSTSGDPTGSWNAYAFVTGKACPDQPWMGTSSDKIVLSLNTFSACDGTFTGGMMWAINKTDLLSGVTPRFATWGPTLNLLNLVPVQAMSATTTAYVAWPIQPNYVRVFTLTGVPPATVTLGYHDYTVSALTNAPNAVQPGTSYTLRTGDNRLRDGFWSGGRLWITYTDGCVPSGDTVSRACVRLSQLDTTNQTVLQDFDVGAAGEYTFYPALRQDASGSLIVVFGVSSTSIYPSVVVASRRTTDPANTLGPWVVLRAGSGARTPGNGNCIPYVCRYGDYFGAAVDPSNTSRVWTAGEYGSTTGWGTYVNLVSVPGSAPPPPPPPPPPTVTLSLSYSIQGGGSGYTAPTLTYVLSGAAKTATLTTSPVGYTVDTNSSWSVTNPLAGSSPSERWQTSQAAGGTATSSVTIAFAYYHQFAVSFAYQVLGGGTGCSAPTVSYGVFGSAASVVAPGSAWADAGTGYSYPTALPGSGSTEAWRTESPTGTVSGPLTVSVAFYHQYLVTFAYSIVGGGTGFGAPAIRFTQFGTGTSTASGTPVWVDSGSSYSFDNPLAGSGSTARAIANAASGVVSSSGTVTLTYYHQYLVSFSFSVRGGGSAYSAPSVTYTTFGAAASTSTGVTVWADAGSGYTFQSPLPGSTTSESWRTNVGAGTIAQTGSLAATYYHQFLITFLVQVVNGPLPGSMPQVNCTVFGATRALQAGGSVWVDANGSYSYPATFPGTAGERWQSISAPQGTITGAVTLTASYYHQYSVAFAYRVSGGGTTYSAPSVTYAQLGSSLATTAGSTVWADAGSAYVYADTLPGSSGSERWMTASSGGSITASGTVSPTYLHQFLDNFTYSVTGGGAAYLAPNVTYANLGASMNTTATNRNVWADAGTTYVYQNPLPGSTSTNGWRTNNGNGKVASSTTYSATYRHQYRLKFKTTSLSGTPTPVTPLINATVFGTLVGIPSGSEAWVDVGGTYDFPGVFYGPLAGERWITDTPANGTVNAPMNLTAAYVHQYYLTIQVNSHAGGSVSLGSGWYNETAPLVLQVAVTPGWQFQGWVGSGNGSYAGAAPSASVAMDGPVTETAVFYVGVTLAASSGGSLLYAYGGSSGSVPAGSSETLYVAPGTNVTVTAAPSWFYQFDGWNGGGSTSASTRTVAVDSPSSLSAGFTISLYSKADSLLGIVLLLAATLLLWVGVRHRRRKRKLAVLRAARARAAMRPQSSR